MERSLKIAAFLLLFFPLATPAQTFTLAPALAIEAEDFTIDSGWKVLQNGSGNYMVDIIGFNHISGERLLHVDSKNESAAAHLDVVIPEAGKYRLWVRYEAPFGCETRFKVQVEQDGKLIVDKLMGTKYSPRYGQGEDKPTAEHDTASGSEGLMEEVVTVPALAKGKATLKLLAASQPQTPGVAANRNIDLIYLTRDTSDAWFIHYRKHVKLYPILEAFRDTRGARWEARFTNRGNNPADFSISHTYNRLPWGEGEGIVARSIKPGESSEWVGLKKQDTAHFGMSTFNASHGQAFAVALRAVGGAVAKEIKGVGPHRIYIPPYAGKGEKPVTPEEEIDSILQDLKELKAPGKPPTKPLCYGGWVPLGVDSDYGRKYAQLYAALGFRSLHPAHSGPAVLKNLAAVAIQPTKSFSVSAYRNPPLPPEIARAKLDLARSGMAQYVRWFDYGDEIAFSEWMEILVQHAVKTAKLAGETYKPEDVVASMWREWLKSNRDEIAKEMYWRASWGAFNERRLKPDTSSAAARENPRLYVDSLQFYQDTAIIFVAERAKDVRRELGEDVLCGANYTCHPLYYPTVDAYIKWFRGGAADMGRHSEFFWQVGQAGPMVNGYIAEHFRAGMRDNPRGVLRQYTMPHAAGNTDANFLRTCFTQLAHGATALDFFGIGMNETFTENHIDHRAKSRFRVLRDITHCVGFVEDLLPQAKTVASPVALLVSESTERWDFAGVAREGAGRDLWGPDFRKVRLNSHNERLGLWTALTHIGLSPDLVIEEDLNAKILDQYKVLFLVGDTLPSAVVPALEKWVRTGGTLIATAGAGRFDVYRQENDAFASLCGLKSRVTEERTPFFRPRMELPFLTPFTRVQVPGGGFPQLATYERVEGNADTKIRAKFKDDDTPAILERKLDKGHVVYVAALPGVAYLWSALQPPLVPDRGPNTHSIPTQFDVGVATWLTLLMRSVAVEPIVDTEDVLIDTRLLRAESSYLLPLANYSEKIGQKVTLKVRIDRKITKVTSAYHGVLQHKIDKGVLTVTIPALGYGDILRLEP